MKILIICDSFYPNRNAPANRYLSLISEWSIDNKITLLTRDTKNKDLTEIRNIININNFELVSSNKYLRGNTLLKKSINLFIFFVSSVFDLNSFKNRRFDIVLSSSPSLITFLIGYFASKKFNSEFIIEIRDIWSESLRDLKIIQSNLIYKLVYKYEQYFYKKAKKIICVSNNIKKKIGYEKKSFVFTNFAPIDIIKSKFINNNSKTKKINFEDIKLLYLGTIGLSHEFETIFKCMKEFRNFNLSIVGEGLQKNKIKINSSKNINFYEKTYDLKSIKNYYKSTDFVLILLKNINIFKSVIPSKIFESAYLNKPIIYLGPKNEASGLIMEYGLGFCAHDINDLVNIFKYISNNHVDIKGFREKFEIFNKIYSTNLISKKYLYEILSK